MSTKVHFVIPWGEFKFGYIFIDKKFLLHLSDMKVQRI